MSLPQSPTTADEVRYRSVVFLNAVLPVLAGIVAARPELARGFAGRDAAVQISCLASDGVSIDGRAPRLATTLLVIDGVLRVSTRPHPAPNLELEFASREKLNAFFLGKAVLPRIRGTIGNVALLVATVRSLLAMSKLLGAAQPPADPATADLLVRSMFRLLVSGISQLNKAGHPKVRRWSERQPDRVYQLTVTGRPELGAHIRVKAGRTKACGGQYARSKPFFAMAFDSPRSALGILLEVDDMVAATRESKLEMQGAPEYGAELGELMFLVGGYAK